MKVYECRSLPRVVFNRLLARQNGTVTEQVVFHAPRAYSNRFLIGFGCAALAFLGWFWYGVAWMGLLAVFAGALLFFGTLAFVLGLYRLATKDIQRLADAIYITRLHVIKIKSGWVYAWPLTSLKDVQKIVCNKNGTFDHVDIRIAFADQKDSVSAKSIEIADIIVQNVRTLFTAVQQAVKAQDEDYQTCYDDFAGAGDPMGPDRLLRQKILSCCRLFAFSALMLGVFLPLYGTNARRHVHAPFWVLRQDFPEDRNDAWNAEMAKRLANGGSRIAGFVQTSDVNGIFELRDLTNNVTVVRWYVRGKGSAAIAVPEGRYSLWRMSGQDWYGDTYLFGDAQEFVCALQEVELTGGEVSGAKLSVTRRKRW